jgi:DNA-binding CsgD family transcriptional regulator
MSPQAGWILQEQVVPRLRASIPRNVNCVGAEDTEELIADGTLMAAKLMDRAEKQGKSFTPGNVAYFTVLHMKSGRRANGFSNSDAFGAATQLNRRSTLNSLEEIVAEDENGNEIFQIHDVLSNNQEDPSTIAARNLDWQTLLSRLTEREKAIVVYLLEGKTVSDVAVVFKVSRSTMQQCKERLVELIQEFMGVDILIEILRLPGWKNGLNASRERLACRFERRN